MVVEARGATAMVFQVACDGYYVDDFVIFFVRTLRVPDCAYCRIPASENWAVAVAVKTAGTRHPDGDGFGS